MPADPVSVEIARLGAQGDGVAETADGKVFVRLALPGERVTVEIDGEQGRLVAIERASPDRVPPPCPHFGHCGGCSAQHMSEALYRAWKQELVHTAFAHRGLEPVIECMFCVPPATRRRATFSAARIKGRIVLGYHEESSRALVDITTCHVTLPAITQALAGLREMADIALRDGREPVRLGVTATTAGLDVGFEGLQGRPDAGRLARISQIASRTGIIRITSDGEILMQSAVPRLRLSSAEVALPPAAFIQATAEAENAIAEILAGAVGKAKRIADLFCGLGTFTFGLARRARVLAADGDRLAVAALSAAAKAVPGIKPIEARVRDLLHLPLSRQELGDFDAVVFDPPRAGAKAQAEALARSKVPVVCAVSCNPATLARDCRILVDGGYVIERVVPIDQFVWSSHVESVVVLRRPRSGS